MTAKRVFISADHGLAIVYFLQSDVVKTLLEGGAEVVLLTDDSLKEKITQRFGRPGLTIEGLRLKEARRYLQQEQTTQQWWLDFFRRAGPSRRMNLETVNNYVNWVEFEAPPKRKALFPLVKATLGVLRRSKTARRKLVDLQKRFTPHLYDDLFERYRPDLVVASTAGWRLDRYLLRDAAACGITTGAIVLGWDNPSSHALPGAKIDYISCWSEAQKQELVKGSDWDPERIHIGGIPSYDGYFEKRWLMPREEYFKLHNLEPQRKLLGYACSFVTYSPNIQNIAALARMVASDRLAEPSQLLVRLHPNHFTDVKRWANEREQIRALVNEYPHVHLVEPVPLGGELGYYSGEDMPEKSSMMAHSDVFLTVYSTMAVEASIHETPIVSAVINSPSGWPGEYSLPLTEIGGWPTHSRFRESGAGKVAAGEAQLLQAINAYLKNPHLDREAQRAFVKQECTYTDGSAGRCTGQYLLSIA
ncbi:MAG: hypothetical protein P8074_13185 [Anaerolineales bacterium]|jgi:hypothetical protein